MSIKYNKNNSNKYHTPRLNEEHHACEIARQTTKLSRLAEKLPFKNLK